MDTTHAIQTIEMAAIAAASTTLNKLADHVLEHPRLVEAVRTLGVSHSIAVWQVALKRVPLPNEVVVS